MAIERTLSIIKPDGTKRNLIGKVLTKFEEAGLRIVGAKLAQLSRAEAEGFYAVHSHRPFFGELVDFMISGPVLISVLEGDNAVLRNRDIMGATNPKDAAPGTVRASWISASVTCFNSNCWRNTSAAGRPGQRRSSRSCCPRIRQL